MSILTEWPPETACIGGADYQINTDFRTILTIYEIMDDPELSQAEKSALAISEFYAGGVSIGFWDEALQEMAAFISGGVRSFARTGKTLVSFEKDAEYIYGAFLETYGLDLVGIPFLHWYRFLALFKALTSHKIVEIIEIRGKDIGKIKDKDQKRQYRDLQRNYSLELRITDAEREQNAKLEAALRAGEDISDLIGGEVDGG